MRIPFFGWAARSLDCIEVDRRKGAEAIPLMMAQAHAAVDRGCRIVIFPEGTRKAPLAAPDYRQGIVRLYMELNVPVVPVAAQFRPVLGPQQPRHLARHGRGEIPAAHRSGPLGRRVPGATQKSHRIRIGCPDSQGRGSRACPTCRFRSPPQARCRKGTRSSRPDHHILTISPNTPIDIDVGQWTA